MATDLEPGAGIPPAIALLLNEQFSWLDRQSARRKLRSMVRPIKEQTLSEAKRELFLLPKPNPDPFRFRVFMSGGLNLFSWNGACIDLMCRLKYAEQIARSIALMADDVWFTDYITERFLDLRKPTNADLDVLLDDVYVLQKLRPLVQAGIVRFCSPLRPLCSGCLSNFDNRLDSMTERMLNEFRTHMRVERPGNDRIHIHVGPMYDPPVVFHAPGEWASKSDDEALASHVYKCVRQALWTAHDASACGGALFSNSKVGLAGLMAEEGRLPGGGSLAVMEGHRAGQLPWVSGLSIEQTLHLREEAARALPQLREFLAKHLTSRPDEAARPATIAEDYVAELRQQAAEVRAELSVASTGRPSLARNVLGLLTLGTFAYGFARETMDVTTGLFQLLTTLGFLHQMSTPEAQHAERLRSRAGYVLVAAQDLLAHAGK